MSNSAPTVKKPRITRFGEKLRFLRTQSGLTLKELANALGYLAHGHLSELEAGKKMPTVEFVLSVSSLFEVTTDQLLKDELDVQMVAAKSANTEEI